MEFQKNILLSRYTSIRLGGEASLFMNCTNTEELKEILEYVNEKKKKLIVFSGGSNIIFPDIGFEGLVLRLVSKGIITYDDEKYFYADVNAGENWDEFVRFIISAGYSGIECLSGIPGSVGATPVQNVGAYGQEVMDTILSVSAIDRKTLEERIFSNDECEFGYRTSRFKTFDKDKYVIFKVVFRFEKNKNPEIIYPELQNMLEVKSDYSSFKTIKEKIRCIRENVIVLRGKKSMIIRNNDINSISCGSFFMNPVLNETEYENFKNRTKEYADVPVYRKGAEYKISAAWLVERSGFKKGYRKGGAGISSNHSLALINVNGTTDELLSLAEDIERTVKEKFGIILKKEPVIVEN